MKAYQDLIQKYAVSGPRYTSYPSANHFIQNFDPRIYTEAAKRSNRLDDQANLRPLSLYIHIPFCSSICYYCGCNKIIGKNKGQAEPYLDMLFREIEMQAELFKCDSGQREVRQIHFGGGTPSFLTIEQMRRVWDAMRKHFYLIAEQDAEYSIELDPRNVSLEQLQQLRELGFNRISIGVQDFNQKVQQAVNRVQSNEHILALMQRAKALGFKSTSVDLIYGLPFQNCETFRDTVNTLVEAAPDRVSVFNYAHLPALFKPQRRINEADLPSPQEKLRMQDQFIKQLQDAGYRYIGMDHFAKPDDELSIAQQQGRLHRNFQGYSTHAECDLIGLGVSAIGKVDGCYAQNAKTMEAYQEAIGQGRLALVAGFQMNADDRLREHIIMDLMCHLHLDIQRVESKYQVKFKEYFADAVPRLEAMQADGLLSLSDTEIQVHPIGAWFIRNICMLFDNYLSQSKTQYSKVV